MTGVTGRSRGRAAAALACLSLGAGAYGDGQTSGPWTIEMARDPASYRNVAVLHQDSAATVSDEYGAKEVNPRLEFRCEPGGDSSIAVRIDWRRFISSFNTELQFSADNENALTAKFGVDRSNKITSTKNSADDTRLLDYLQGHDELTVGVTPYSEAPLSVQYDLSGFGAALDRLRDACAD